MKIPTANFEFESEKISKSKAMSNTQTNPTNVRNNTENKPIQVAIFPNLLMIFYCLIVYADSSCEPKVFGLLRRIISTPKNANENCFNN